MIDALLPSFVSVARFVRDRAYDTVFHVGDTSLQFVGDLVRGSNSFSTEKYHHRQLDRQERKKVEKPLKYEEKQIFSKLMERQKTETILEHWKRRKALLSAPDKHDLVSQYRSIELRRSQVRSKNKSNQALAQKRQLEQQFKDITNAKHGAGQGQKR